VWECGEGQTDTHMHTDSRDQYTFRLSYMPHAKCNKQYRPDGGETICSADVHFGPSDDNDYRGK